jgi:hypothetical protein
MAGEFFVVVDKQHMECGGTLFRAVEVLYKIFHVFNLDYPLETRNFFCFFDLFVFKYTKAKPTVQVTKFFNRMSTN